MTRRQRPPPGIHQEELQAAAAFDALDKDTQARLLSSLQGQIEFYFSPENLAHDAFLRSVMEEPSHVGAFPVELLINFPKIRQLYATSMSLATTEQPADARLVLCSLESSDVVSISADGQWIIPRLIPAQDHSIPLPPPPSEQPQRVPASPSSSQASSSAATLLTHSTTHQPKERTTVIVRDLPESCTLDEIVQIFTVSVGQPKSVRHEDVGNTWYVTFPTEASAIQAILETSSKKIHGSAIHARLKSQVVPTVTATTTSTAATTNTKTSMSLPAVAAAPDLFAPQQPAPVPSQMPHPYIPPPDFDYYPVAEGYPVYDFQQIQQPAAQAYQVYNAVAVPAFPAGYYDYGYVASYAEAVLPAPSMLSPRAYPPPYQQQQPPLQPHPVAHHHHRHPHPTSSYHGMQPPPPPPPPPMLPVTVSMDHHAPPDHVYISGTAAVDPPFRKRRFKQKKGRKSWHNKNNGARQIVVEENKENRDVFVEHPTTAPKMLHPLLVEDSPNRVSFDSQPAPLSPVRQQQTNSSKRGGNHHRQKKSGSRAKGGKHKDKNDDKKVNAFDFPVLETGRRSTSRRSGGGSTKFAYADIVKKPPPPKPSAEALAQEDEMGALQEEISKLTVGLSGGGGEKKSNPHQVYLTDPAWAPDSTDKDTYDEGLWSEWKRL